MSQETGHLRSVKHRCVAHVTLGLYIRAWIQQKSQQHNVTLHRHSQQGISEGTKNQKKTIRCEIRSKGAYASQATTFVSPAV